MAPWGAIVYNEIEKMNQAQRQAAAQIQSQQEAVLNSMAEGLLLLDGSGRIQLANRAFADLFGVSQNLRRCDQTDRRGNCQSRGAIQPSFKTFEIGFQN